MPLLPWLGHPSLLWHASQHAARPHTSARQQLTPALGPPSICSPPRLFRLLLSLPQSFSAQLGGDPIVHSHLSALYDTMLEQNLLRRVQACLGGGWCTQDEPRMLPMRLSGLGHVSNLFWPHSTAAWSPLPATARVPFRADHGGGADPWPAILSCALQAD